jgi:hypothetical protein
MDTGAYPCLTEPIFRRSDRNMPKRDISFCIIDSLSRSPTPKCVPANFRRVLKELTLLLVNLGKWLEEICSYFVVHVTHGF